MTAPRTRAVVFGLGGTLGRALGERLPEHGIDIVGPPPGRASCDIGDREAVERVVSSLRPQVVFNAVAFTDVDGAEDQGEEAFRVNAQGAENVAVAAARAGARLVHYSTDFVFDGERPTPYDEDVPAVPRSLYGRSKLEGDRLALAACPRAAVLRVGCLYGQGGRNFPSTVLARLRRGDRLRVDDERRVSPTWVTPLADLSAAVALTEVRGLFHATSHGDTTWAEFARTIARLAGVAAPQIQAMSSNELALKAARPRRAVLDNRRLREVGLDLLDDWAAQAERYVATCGP